MAARHPAAALALVGLVAFAESLAVIGTLVPAAFVMFGAGALAGHGTLPLPWTLAIATLGAIAGDTLSFELGQRHEERVRNWPLFRRYEDPIRRAEGLVRKHGATSVLMARFTGAVRAFVPLLAGFARMPRGRFYATNVLSALLWAPAHILPGVAFGASLHLAEQASGRIAAVLLLLAGLLWAAVWLARLTFRVLVPLARKLRSYAWEAVRAHPGRWTAFPRLLLDPERPDSAALLASLAVLVGAMWLFLGVVEDVVSGDPLVVADQAVFTFLQQLRTPPADQVMVRITELGSVGVLLPLIVAVAAWLAVQRCWRTAGYWLATVASAEIVVQVLKRTLGRHRPLAMYQGVEQYSFPSGHATISAVVLVYLAFLLSRGQSMRWRVGVAAVAAVYVTLVGFSRLYLGAHWMSDVAGGFSFGLAAVALSAIVYTQHGVREAIRPRRLALVAGFTIATAGTVWAAWRGPHDLQQYTPVSSTREETLQAWIGGGFRQLPAYRREFAGESKEAFTVQIACTDASLGEALHRAGWVAAPGLSIPSVMQAIAPNPQVGALPLLPRFDAGRSSAIEVVQEAPLASHARTVLRLWRSDSMLPGDIPLWYGAYEQDVQVRPNYSVLRAEPLDARRFSQSLTGAGLTWLNQGESQPDTPQLWTCSAR